MHELDCLLTYFWIALLTKHVKMAIILFARTSAIHHKSHLCNATQYFNLEKLTRYSFQVY